MKIVVCGSMSFSKQMLDLGKSLEGMGHKVVLPRNTHKYAKNNCSDADSPESTKNKIENDLIRDYFKKIKDSDVVLVANYDKKGISNYIGGNSFLELAFGFVLHKKVVLLNPIPKMSYTDEIVAMQPFVLDGKIENIKNCFNISRYNQKKRVYCK